MYRYDEFDAKFVAERVQQFRGQVTRRLAGELADQRPLNFEDWDAQRGGVQHHLLQCGAALRHHE